MMVKNRGKVSLRANVLTSNYCIHNRIKIDKQDFLIVFNMAKDNEKQKRGEHTLQQPHCFA